MASFGINETSRFTIDFLTERAFDGTRLAAVVVVHDAHDRQPRTWREGLRVLLRRLFDRARLRVEMRARAHAYSQSHPRPDVKYEADRREVSALGQRWQVPDGLTLVLRIDRPYVVEGQPIVRVRTVSSTVVPTESITVEPGASREAKQEQISAVIRRRREAESRAWAVALLADEEAASLIGRKLLEGMADGR